MAGGNIPWRRSLNALEEAREEAMRDEKLFLVDLFNPG